MTSPMRAIVLAAAVLISVVPRAFAQGAPTPAAPGSTAPPATAAPSNEPFGQEVMLEAKTIVFIKGNSTWDKAFETLVDAYRSLYTYLEKQGVKPAGPAMTIYTSADDTGFTFEAAVPIAETFKDPPKGDIAVGQSPTGRALKFFHRGSYDSMDNTYEAITNYLDERQLEARDLFVEEYRTDLLKMPEDRLEIDIYVPLK